MGRVETADSGNLFLSYRAGIGLLDTIEGEVAIDIIDTYASPSR